MLGMVPGEERTWEFVFPDDWHVDLWRGQTAVAKVKVVELFSYILPEVSKTTVVCNCGMFCLCGGTFQRHTARAGGGYDCSILVCVTYSHCTSRCWFVEGSDSSSKGCEALQLSTNRGLCRKVSTCH